MNKLEISMFGKFCMKVDNTDILAKFGGSRKKTDLIQFLILNTDKDVSNLEIFYTLWPNEENINPESSFKTLVSRLRASLSELGLKNCIQTRGGFYKWNKVNSYVDIFRFEQLYNELKDVDTLTDESKLKFDEIIEIYKGDLLSDSDGNSWIIPKAVFYHNLYLAVINQYIKLLKKNHLYNEIMHIARKGLEIDAFDSKINLELMNALVELNRSPEALAQYKYTTGLHYTYLGIDPSDEILGFYKRLAKQDSNMDAELAKICAQFKTQQSSDDGALVCDYSILKEIYRINYRNLKRLGSMLYLGFIQVTSIDDSSPNSLMLDMVMNTLLETLRKTLRSGDTISKYSTSEYALLIPSTNSDSVITALERVKKNFYSNYSTPEYMINYKIKLIEE